jgi:hypothetical protein
MKYILIVGWFTLGTWVWTPVAGARDPARTRPPAKSFAPPRLRIEPAGRVDLGELGPLEPRVRHYRIINTSAAPIRLRLLDLSPGVTVAGPALEQPIPPGTAAGLDLRVDPADWAGLQQRNVRLGTDDPAQGNYYLPVRMRVRPDLAVDGIRRSFGDVGVQESPQVAYTFTRETGRPLTLRVATPLPPYLECEIQGIGPNAQLAFTFRAARVQPGMRLGLERVRVETNAPLQPSFDLYLEWRLHHAVEPEPARVVFTGPEPDTLELRLTSRAGTAFRILEAKLEGAGFQVGVVPGDEAPEQVLAIRCTAAAPARAMLVLRCTGAEGPLRVPVAYLPVQPGRDEGVMVESSGKY